MYDFLPIAAIFLASCIVLGLLFRRRLTVVIKAIGITLGVTAENEAPEISASKDLTSNGEMPDGNENISNTVIGNLKESTLIAAKTVNYVSRK